VTVAEAFERGEARVYDLGEIIEDQGGDLIWDSVAEVDPDDRVAVTGSGERIRFDALAVATGALATEPLPGALTFRGRADVPALRGLLGEWSTVGPSRWRWRCPRSGCGRCRCMSWL